MTDTLAKLRDASERFADAQQITWDVADAIQLGWEVDMDDFIRLEEAVQSSVTETLGERGWALDDGWLGNADKNRWRVYVPTPLTDEQKAQLAPLVAALKGGTK